MPLEPPEPGTVGETERYRTLLEINNALISNLTRDDLFRAIAQALRRVVPFERTAIFLHDPDKDVLKLFILESELMSSYFTVGLDMPMARLVGYPWSGNVRELQNVIERAVVLRQGSVFELGLDLLPVSGPPMSGSGGEAAPAPSLAAAKRELGGSSPVLPTLADMERAHILAALEDRGWLIEGPKGAARILALHPNTLRSRMEKLGIKRHRHDSS